MENKAIDRITAETILKLEALTAVIARYNGDKSDANKDAVTAAVKELTKAEIAEHAARLVDGKSNPEILALYADNQWMNVSSVSYGKEDKTCELVPATSANARSIWLPFAAVNSATDKPIIPATANISSFCRVLLENIVINESDKFTDDSGHGYATRYTLFKGVEEFRQKAGSLWQQTSNNALLEQLQTIANWLMGDEAPHMIKADIRFLRKYASFIKEADNKEEAAKIAVKRGKDMERNVWRAIYIRRNRLAYSFQNEQEKGRGGKADGKTVTAGEAVQNPAETPVTVTVPETAAPAARTPAAPAKRTTRKNSKKETPAA